MLLIALNPKYKIKHINALNKNETIALEVKLPQQILIAANTALRKNNPI